MTIPQVWIFLHIFVFIYFSIFLFLFFWLLPEKKKINNKTISLTRSAYPKEAKTRTLSREGEIASNPMEKGNKTPQSKQPKNIPDPQNQFEMLWKLPFKYIYMLWCGSISATPSSVFQMPQHQIWTNAYFWGHLIYQHYLTAPLRCRSLH